jgi:hypothetical protein
MEPLSEKERMSDERLVEVLDDRELAQNLTNDDFPYWYDFAKTEADEVWDALVAERQHSESLSERVKVLEGEMRDFCERVMAADKTERYDYGIGKRALNRKGEHAGVGERWLTPHEMAYDKLRSLPPYPPKESEEL